MLYPDKNSLLDGLSCQTNSNNRQSKALRSILLMHVVVVVVDDLSLFDAQLHSCFVCVIEGKSLDVFFFFFAVFFELQQRVSSLPTKQASLI